MQRVGDREPLLAQEQLPVTNSDRRWRIISAVGTTLGSVASVALSLANQTSTNVKLFRAIGLVLGTSAAYYWTRVYQQKTRNIAPEQIPEDFGFVAPAIRDPLANERKKAIAFDIIRRMFNDSKDNARDFAAHFQENLNACVQAAFYDSTKVQQLIAENRMNYESFCKALNKELQQMELKGRLRDQTAAVTKAIDLIWEDITQDNLIANGASDLLKHNILIVGRVIISFCNKMKRILESSRDCDEHLRPQLQALKNLVSDYFPRVAFEMTKQPSAFTKFITDLINIRDFKAETIINLLVNNRIIRDLTKKQDLEDIRACFGPKNQIQDLLRDQYFAAKYGLKDYINYTTTFLQAITPEQFEILLPALIAKGDMNADLRIGVVELFRQIKNTEEPISEERLGKTLECLHQLYSDFEIYTDDSKKTFAFDTVHRMFDDSKANAHDFAAHFQENLNACVQAAFYDPTEVQQLIDENKRNKSFCIALNKELQQMGLMGRVRDQAAAVTKALVLMWADVTQDNLIANGAADLLKHNIPTVGGVIISFCNEIKRILESSRHCEEHLRPQLQALKNLVSDYFPRVAFEMTKQPNAFTKFITDLINIRDFKADTIINLLVNNRIIRDLTKKQDLEDIKACFGGRNRILELLGDQDFSAKYGLKDYINYTTTFLQAITPEQFETLLPALIAKGDLTADLRRGIVELFRQLKDTEKPITAERLVKAHECLDQFYSDFEIYTVDSEETDDCGMSENLPKRKMLERGGVRYLPAYNSDNGAQ